jgi:hypothetical protein
LSAGAGPIELRARSTRRSRDDVSRVSAGPGVSPERQCRVLLEWFSRPSELRHAPGPWMIVGGAEVSAGRPAFWGGLGAGCSAVDGAGSGEGAAGSCLGVGGDVGGSCLDAGRGAGGAG